MTALTLRRPDQKNQRQQAFAQALGTSVNRLLDDMTTQVLVDFDAETGFRLRAASGANQAERGLDLLKKATG